jgi:hypothetical protein
LISDSNAPSTEEKIPKSKHQISNNKWFDKPFDHLDKLGIFNRLTVLSKVKGLTTLSLSKGKFRYSRTKTFGILVISLS